MAVFPVFNAIEGGTGLAVWRSVFHSVAAFCNAGFDLMGGSGMTPFVSHPLFNVVTITLVFCGGIGASVIMNVRGRIFKKQRITFNTKVILLSSVIVLFVGALYIFVAEFNNAGTIGSLPLGEKVMASFFHSMATRSAGFNVIDPYLLTPGGYVVSDILMFIGVAPASTGGGIKLATLVVLLFSIRTTVSGGGEYNFCKRSISNRTFNKAVSIFVIYILVLLGALLVLCITDPQIESDALMFECISAMSNCGLSMYGTANVSVAGRYVLMLLMYIGRAGFLCVVYSLSNSTKPNIKYPDSKLIIG